MNCAEGICRYKTDGGICKVDNKKCDYRKIGGEHCRQENNPTLKQIHHDCDMMNEVVYEPFFSCYNLCKLYASCTKE